MKNRFNGDYKIIESVELNENEELVIGYNPAHPITSYKFVCWYYNRPNNYYFWGHYTDSLKNAQIKLNERKNFN